MDRLREGNKYRWSYSSHPDKASNPWFDSSIFSWCKRIPAVVCSLPSVFPIKSIIRCPEAAERKKGKDVHQRKQIHNPLSYVQNEKMLSGIVELNWWILRWVISCSTRIKPTISSHESVSIPSNNESLLPRWGLSFFLCSLLARKIGLRVAYMVESAIQLLKIPGSLDRRIRYHKSGLVLIRWSLGRFLGS